MSTFRLFSLVVAAITIAVIGWLLYSKSHPPVQLASDFPSLPVYPNARLIATSSDPHEGAMYVGIKYSATWQSDAAVPEVMRWYLEKLPSDGWKLDTPPAQPNSNSVQLATLTNPDYSLNVSVMHPADSRHTLIVMEISTNYLLFKEKNVQPEK